MSKLAFRLDLRRSIEAVISSAAIFSPDLHCFSKGFLLQADILSAGPLKEISKVKAHLPH